MCRCTLEKSHRHGRDSHRHRRTGKSDNSRGAEDESVLGVVLLPINLRDMMIAVINAESSEFHD
jgi:hypothetical protein